MEIGVIGLGRRGSNLARRSLWNGHQVLVYDLDPQAVLELAEEGAVAAESRADLADLLASPRAVWVMVPAVATGRVID